MDEPAAKMNVFADVLNSTPSSRDLTVNVAFDDGNSGSDSATLESGARYRFAIPFSSAVRGLVSATATLSENGQTLATRTIAIGVADAPGAPDARFGLNTLESDEIAVELGGEAFEDPALAARA